MTEVRIPEGLWDEGEKTGSIVVWLYSDGATVSEGDVLAELMVEKVTFEIDAPSGGTLRIHVEPEVPLEKGTLIATIE